MTVTQEVGDNDPEHCGTDVTADEAVDEECVEADEKLLVAG